MAISSVFLASDGDGHELQMRRWSRRPAPKFIEFAGIKNADCVLDVGCGTGSRHEMFGRLGITCRNFRDVNNANATGVMAEIPDMAKFEELLRSDEGKKAMGEDGLKVETMRMLVEFTP